MTGNERMVPVIENGTVEIEGTYLARGCIGVLEAED